MHSTIRIPITEMKKTKAKGGIKNNRKKEKKARNGNKYLKVFNGSGRGSKDFPSKTKSASSRLTFGVARDILLGSLNVKEGEWRVYIVSRSIEACGDLKALEKSGDGKLFALQFIGNPDLTGEGSSRLQEVNENCCFT